MLDVFASEKWWMTPKCRCWEAAVPGTITTINGLGGPIVEREVPIFNVRFFTVWEMLDACLGVHDGSWLTVCAVDPLPNMHSYGIPLNMYYYFFICSLGRFKQEQQCHWAALDASDTYITHGCRCPELAGISISEVGGRCFFYEQSVGERIFLRGFCPKMRWNMSMCSAEIIVLYYCTCTVLCWQMLGTMSMFAC